MIESYRKTKYKKRILIILFAFLALVLLTVGICWTYRVFRSYYGEDTLSILNLSGVNKLMIVAHPDDETLWGGGHLIDGGYLVVCITDGYNKTRKSEFDTAVKHLNETNIPIILNFPDKTLNKRDNWFGIKGKIEDAVEKCINLKDWDLIVTHNKEGEYGHIHHKMTSSIVRSEYKKLDKKNPLYLFGTYHSKKKLPIYEASMTPMSNELYNKKVEVLKDFKSQEKVVESLFHMVRYENWTKYDS